MFAVVRFEEHKGQIIYCELVQKQLKKFCGEGIDLGKNLINGLFYFEISMVRVSECITFYSNSLLDVYVARQCSLRLRCRKIPFLNFDVKVCCIMVSDGNCTIQTSSDFTRTSISLDLLEYGRKTLPTVKTKFRSGNNQYCTGHNVSQLT